METTSITGAFDRMLRMCNLTTVCEDSLERCFDEVCGESDLHPVPLILKAVSQTMVDGFIRFAAAKNPGTNFDNWSVGQKRVHYLWSFRDTFCTAEPEKALAPSKYSEASSADDAKPAKFEINVSVEDAARAGAITAGAALIYKALMFGATICPAARPVTQGIMMLFGMTPTGFEYESPRVRMSREGA